MAEIDLYLALKAFMESAGYTLKGEVPARTVTEPGPVPKPLRALLLPTGLALGEVLWRPTGMVAGHHHRRGHAAV
ncbi:hypothetical protein N8D56_25955 (plasmid) [Devosia sp. A8/3-2]|nr:hypothetical protein N8D56_25955 [Devosia sp. A8/3-2]